MYELDRGATGDRVVGRATFNAAGRVGLTFPEYQALVKGDAELIELERKVLESARARFRADSVR